MTAPNTAPVVEERCPRTDLYPSACAHCRPMPVWLEEMRSELLHSRRGWVTAPHPGECCGCGDDYAPGAAIRPAPGDGWLAECCADEVTTP